jgi:hypothetical protein
MCCVRMSVSLVSLSVCCACAHVCLRLQFMAIIAVRRCVCGPHPALCLVSVQRSPWSSSLLGPACPRPAHQDDRSWCACYGWPAVEEVQVTTRACVIESGSWWCCWRRARQRVGASWQRQRRERRRARELQNKIPKPISQLLHGAGRCVHALHSLFLSSPSIARHTTALPPQRACFVLVATRNEVAQPVARSRHASGSGWSGRSPCICDAHTLRPNTRRRPP